MVGIGIIGVGYWGSNLVRAFNETEGAEMVAVADNRPGRLHFVEKRYPHIGVTPSIEDLLANPRVDAVAIATPVPTHYEVAMRVLDAGKHAFVEKPLAYCESDATALHEKAKALGLTLAVGHVYQFSPAVEWLTKKLANRGLGELFHIDSSRINLGPPFSEVDVVWDLAPHDLSILVYVMWSAGLSTAVRRISVMAGSFTHEHLTDLVHVFLEFECGMSAHIHVSWVATNKVRLMQVSSEMGTVVFDDMMPIEKIKVYSGAVDSRRETGENESGELSYRPGDIFIPTLPRHEPLSAECRHFVDCIGTGSEPINGGKIGVEVVRLLEMISREITIADMAVAV